MSRYRFELASEADDKELRDVLAKTPMDGHISVSFHREPSYFAAAVVEGEFSQTILGRDCEQRRIVGFGVRSVRQMFVNGVSMPIGYLSGLRVLQDYRNLGLIARGYAFFRDLHRDGRTRLYLTTIAEGNAQAIPILTSGRAGLPPYHFAGKYVTSVIPSPPSQRNGLYARDGRVRIRRATRDKLPNVLEFLKTAGRQRQFFPDYGPNDFFQPRSTFRDLEPDDLLIASHDDRIVGTLGLWDQQGFRQSVVERYSTALRWMRPLYNGWARWRGRPHLPSVGEAIPHVVGAVPVVADDNPSIFAALLAAARARIAEGTANYLLIGLHEADPLRPVVRQQEIAAYVTRLYYVCWEDGDHLRHELDGRPPYLELGTL